MEKIKDSQEETLLFSKEDIEKELAKKEDDITDDNLENSPELNISEILENSSIDKEKNNLYADKYEKLIEEEEIYISQTKKFYDKEHDQITPTAEYLPELDNPLALYKKILSLASDPSRLNEQINNFLNSDGTNSEIRTKLLASYWDFCETLIKNDTTTFSLEFKYLLRFGLIVSSAVSAPILEAIKNVNMETNISSYILYLDEWLQKVSKQKLSLSVVDETAVSTEGLLASQDNKIKQLKNQNDTLIQKATEIDKNLNEKLDAIINIASNLQNRTSTDFGFSNPLTPEQMQSTKSIKELLNLIQKHSEEIETKLSLINTSMNSIQKTEKEMSQLKQERKIENKSDKNKDLLNLKEEEKNADNFHSKVTYAELLAVRQMMKLSVGKRGNHFPMLFKNFFSGPESIFGTKKQVLTLIEEIEKIDFSIFQRIIKGYSERVFPNILLAPCYGQTGICWEPYDKYNKNTSAAKILIPMYPQDLSTAIIEALGDFRWQFAKEQAGYSWMEEGLSGFYFQWFETNIKKGNVKEQFISDYLTWIKWESMGSQKLHKEIRGLFWRYMPFNNDIKQELGRRSHVYADLIKKDKNRALQF